MRVRHYPLITKTVCNDEEGLRSDQKVSPWVNGVDSPVQAELETQLSRD